MLRSTMAMAMPMAILNPKLKKLNVTPKMCIPISTIPQTPQCPPPICQNPPPTSAYIHLPFCRKRCHYCDFPIIALGSFSSSSFSSEKFDPRIENYISLLLREIKSTVPHLDGPPLETVFFGRGTPSLVPPQLVGSVLDLLRSKLGIRSYAEVSMEMDPGTFDQQKLKELTELGVNRVSIGVQAFQEQLLSVCGRAHGVREVEEAVEVVKGCDGVESWSMDLIASLPGQTEGMWRESLRQAVEAGPEHISVYDLQVEQGTKFAQLYTPGEFPLPSETQSANFYKIASVTLTNAGYNHYEISSYCKDGYECKHNLTYWQNKPFYAFGLGSASYINGTRFSRPRKLKDYTTYVENLEQGVSNVFHTNSSSVETNTDLAMDTVMLSLRTARGLDVKRFGRLFGKSLVSALCEGFAPYVESGHVIVMDDEKRRLRRDEFDEVRFIRLGDPDGFLLSNELIAIAFGIISP